MGLLTPASYATSMLGSVGSKKATALRGLPGAGGRLTVTIRRSHDPSSAVAEELFDLLAYNRRHREVPQLRPPRSRIRVASACMWVSPCRAVGHRSAKDVGGKIVLYGERLN